MNIYNNQKLLANNLKQLRIINEKTLKELAELTGISVSNLNHYELGKRTIKPIDFYNILNQYKISLAQYLTVVTNSISVPSHWKKLNQIPLLYEKNKYEILLLALNKVESIKLTLFNEFYLDKLFPFKSRGIVYSFSDELILIINKDEISLRMGEVYSFSEGTKIIFRSLSKEAVECMITLEEDLF
jgi:transcriptional regulator with XRE-family HTH domain